MGREREENGREWDGGGKRGGGEGENRGEKKCKGETVRLSFEGQRPLQHSQHSLGTETREELVSERDRIF